MNLTSFFNCAWNSSVKRFSFSRSSVWTSSGSIFCLSFSSRSKHVQSLHGLMESWFSDTLFGPFIFNEERTGEHCSSLITSKLSVASDVMTRSGDIWKLKWMTWPNHHHSRTYVLLQAPLQKAPPLAGCWGAHRMGSNASLFMLLLYYHLGCKV